MGDAMGVVIALAVAPPIASYLGWSFDLAEMPFWGRLIADLFVLEMDWLWRGLDTWQLKQAD